MKQIKYEILKYLNRFTLIFIAMMFILNLTVVFFQYINYLDPQMLVIKEAKSALFEDYKNNREKFDNDYKDFQTRKSEYELALRQSAMSGETSFALNFINKKIDFEFYGDMKLYADVMEVINGTENYNRNINKVLSEAYSKIKEIGIKKNQYIYEYQVALVLHYGNLSELDIIPEDQYGWSDFFTLQTPIIFLIITFIGVFTNVFIIERRTRIANILNICKNGEIKLIRAKLSAIAVLSTTFTLLFSLSPLIILNFTTGLSNPSQYIQAVDILKLCPYLFEIWKYLLFFIIVKIIVFLLFALFIAILGQLFGNEILVFVMLFIYLILSYLLSLSGVHSPFFFLKKFNFFDLAFVNILFDRYRALNIFNLHVSFLLFVIALFGIVFISLIALSFILKLKNKSNFITLSILTKFIYSKTKKNKLEENSGTSILNFEFRKYLFNKQRILILVVAVFIKIVIANVYFAPLITNEEKIYKNYIADLHGEINEEKSEYIRKEREYINESFKEYDLAKDNYRNGIIDLAEFHEYSQRYNYAESVKYAFERVEKRYYYLSNISSSTEMYNNIEFIYESGALKYLFSFFDIILVLFAVAMFADVFSNEHQSGFVTIMSISKNGGKKTFISKYLFAFISITSMYIVFSTIDLLFMFKNFDINYLNVGIMSIPEFIKLKMNMNILNYIIIFKIISYICFIILTFIIISVSNIMKNIWKSGLTSLFIIFVPLFLEYFGINILQFMNIVSILNPTYIKDYIPQYIFYLTLTTALTVKSKMDWVKQ